MEKRTLKIKNKTTTLKMDKEWKILMSFEKQKEKKKNPISMFIYL